MAEAKLDKDGTPRKVREKRIPTYQCYQVAADGGDNCVLRGFGPDVKSAEVDIIGEEGSFVTVKVVRQFEQKPVAEIQRVLL